MHCRKRSEFFFVLAQLHSALYRYALDDLHKIIEGPPDFYIRTSVVLVYLLHHLLRDFGTDRRLRDILRTIAATEMVVFTIMEDLDAVCYEVSVYSRAPDQSLYASPKDTYPARARSTLPLTPDPPSVHKSVSGLEKLCAAAAIRSDITR